jgi:nucleoside-diphosphate-sugar epimerase|tara:strand:+ start:1031 stop:1939 length:909 start_codon:yes stop_codon:yes gene_type:complete
MKFAVTGGAGFVGSNIVKLLVKENHDVLVIDNMHTGKKENLQEVFDKIEFYELDIRNIPELENKIKDVDGIFHEAALTIVQESFLMEEEYYDVNVKGTENIFKIAEKYRIKVVFASSSSVYGNTEKIPIIENNERNPINPYGKTKLEDEFLAEKYSDKGVSIIGLRYFNIFGKGQTGSYAGVITKFVNQLKEKKSPIIFGNGSQIRDFIFVEDIAQANLSAMLSKINSGFFNIGTGKTTTILQLAKLLIKLYNLEIFPEFSNPLDGDVQKSQANIKKSQELLNWTYKIEIEEGLEKMIKLKK